ncbi:MAG TPA: hypothetical protein VFY48_08600 [Solirubrobacterales bacterium]|nr:hypothetical protein [Solirubrobacterales bacterium]
MRPERTAQLVAAWARLYTRGLPSSLARRRIAEIEADLHDQIAAERARGAGDRGIALSVLSRMVRGFAADVSWRGGAAAASTVYRLATAVAIGSVLFIFWLMGAVGIIGVEGDPADLMFFGVFAVGIAGAVIARTRPRGAPRALGMARALVAMALAQALVGAVALAAGKHEAAISSVFEILGLTGMFMALFLGSAWLFRQAARRRFSSEEE